MAHVPEDTDRENRQAFDLEIRYIPRRCNAVADLLSRLPEQDDVPAPGLDVCSVAIYSPRRSAAETRDSQLQDPELKTIIEAFEAPESDDFMRYTARGYIMSVSLLSRDQSRGASTGGALS